MDSKRGLISRMHFQICSVDDLMTIPLEPTQRNPSYLVDVKLVDVVLSQKHWELPYAACQLSMPQNALIRKAWVTTLTMLYLRSVDYQSQNPSHDLCQSEITLSPSPHLCVHDHPQSKVRSVVDIHTAPDTSPRSPFFEAKQLPFPPKHSQL